MSSTRPETTPPAAMAQAAAAIRAATYAAYGLCLGGTSWPRKDSIYARMKCLEPGDMVIELSTIHHQAMDLNAVGTFLRSVTEPVVSEPEDDVDEPPPTEPVTYIRTLDGREFRWTNASFLSVPESRCV